MNICCFFHFEYIYYEAVGPGMPTVLHALQKKKKKKKKKNSYNFTSTLITSPV